MESRFVQAGDVRLQYFQHGDGPETVLLVHGYVSSGRLWQLTMGEMDPTRFRVIAVNNRGAGDSDRSPQEDAYSVETFAADLFNVVGYLGLDGFTLVGHSMGGATVTQFALSHQSCLKALVLLNPASLIGRPLQAGWEEAIQEEFRSGTHSQRDMGLDAPHVPKAFAQAIIDDITRNPVERAIGGRRSMSKLRLRERLHELTLPVLVVGGDRDTTVGVANILAEYLAVPEASRSLHIFHGVGHSPNVAVPVEFARVLTHFIEKVRASAKQKVC
jgi:branched-chain amino acid transport system permease protein